MEINQFITTLPLCPFLIKRGVQAFKKKTRVLWGLQ